MMKITSLSLRNFRNYQEQNFRFEQNIYLFTGLNAQGKTNLLESIYLAAFGKSPRAFADMEMVHWDAEQAAVELSFERKQVSHKTLVHIGKDGSKQIKMNDYPVKIREVMGSLNLVFFSPEDLHLIKGAPILRRRFLDMEISQTSKAYYQDLLAYNRLVYQRNHLLRRIREGKASKDQLPSWDGQLAEKGALLVLRRRQALHKMVILARMMHRRLTSQEEKLDILYYQPYWQPGKDREEDSVNSEWYLIKLRQTWEVDILKASTSVGPHRDDLILEINQRNLRIYGSQGQQRTGALAFKLAELEYMRSETGEYPVLLLDDVLSELDIKRREQLRLFIKDKVQTLITTTDESLFPIGEDVRGFQVEKGKIYPLESKLDR